VPANDPKSAFYAPPAYEAAEKMRKLPRMLLGGDLGSATDALMAERETWLPPYSDAERAPSMGGGKSPYEKRVRNAVVKPFYSKAVERMAATILAEPIVLEDDVPELVRGTRPGKTDAALVDTVIAAVQRAIRSIGGGAFADRVGELLRRALTPLLAPFVSRNGGKATIEGHAENIDLRGNNLDVFMRPVVMDLSGEGGMTCVLVDFPRVAEGLSAADIARLALRPFWRHFPAWSVLEAIPEYINGREYIQSIRLRDGLDDEGCETVRIISAAPWVESLGERVGFVMWVTIAKVIGEDKKETEIETGRGFMEPHQEIPLAVAYFGYRGFFRAVPQQLELAHMNLRNTQFDCEIADDLSLSSGAQLVVTGVKEPTDRAAIQIGKRMKMVFEDVGVTAEWLERSGSAATVFMEYKRQDEEEMRSLGNLPLLQRTGTLTATGQAIDMVQAKTEAQADSKAVKDLIERCLTFHAIYLNRSAVDPKGGSVRLRLPSVLIERDPEAIRLSLDVHEKIGVPTAETILAQMKAQGLLPDDLDIDAEIAKAEARKSEGREVAAAIAAGRTATADAQPPPKPNGAEVAGTDGVAAQ
jgi:hypothetical protein